MASTAEVRQRAEAAVRLSVASPLEAQPMAEAALADGLALSDGVAVSTAERALGMAARELDDLPGATAHLHRAIRVARRAKATRAEALARGRLAGTLFLQGKSTQALRETERAAPHLRGLDAARVRVQRALFLQRLGRTAEALEEYRVAIPVLRRGGAFFEELQALVNRGILHAYRGEYGAAEADLRRAEGLGPQIGPGLPIGMIHANLGFVVARRGDVPAALALYDLAERELPTAQVAMVLLDRCETLLAVRLVPEARLAAKEAAGRLEAAGRKSDLAEARLMVAQAALLDGDGRSAEEAAIRARRAFLAQGRPGWATLAGYVALRARWQDGRLGTAQLGRVRALAVDLEEAGWAIPALDARLVAARVALERGRVAEGRQQLLVAAKARTRGPVDLRARAWHAEALLRLASGNRAGAERALRAGVRVLDEHRDTLGATELRVHASARAEELATAGIALALDRGRPDRVFAWAERWRAGALRGRRVRPPDSPAVGEMLGELRSVAAHLESAALEGDDTRALLLRRAALERSIRDHVRHARKAGPPGGGGAPSVGEIRAQLGAAALVEYVSSEGRLHAVTITAGRARLFHLASIVEVAAEIDSLRFAYTRLVRGHGSRASIDAFFTTSEYSTTRLDELLLEPLRQEVGDRPLVLVPTGALHRLPWAGLPSCRGRTVSVCPSASLWLTATRSAPAPTGNVLLVAGPDVPQAPGEIEDLRGRYPRATVLVGEAATAARVARGLDGADLTHVAAHGTFRSDNPLFSALQLADGTLTVYDLEVLERAPQLLVLSACESGISDVRTGDELMGFAAALFALGSRTLIASVVPVPDETTRPLMVAFHDRLAKGEPPAMALARAQATAYEELGLSPAATAGFVCLGA